MAFTAGIPGAETNSHHAVEILANNEVRHVRFFDLPGEDMILHKGDMWKLNFTEFHFTNSCITIGDIERVYIIETNNDGWGIDSIVTIVKDSSGRVEVLTQNVDSVIWIDGDHFKAIRRAELTRAS